MSKLWQERSLMAWLLLPISVLFGCVVHIRFKLYKAGILKVHAFAAPVIVVGNISVGGTGKTPIVSAVVKRCQSLGKKPGIVSRGYGAEPARHPRMVDSNTLVELGGDEPVLLASETGVPVCICVDRSAAVKWLIANNDVDVVISDDGLQHYAMHRDVELAVVDSQRMLGNGWLLPAGPLRERPKRLNQVDIIALQKANSSSSASSTSISSTTPSPNLTSINWAVTGHFQLKIEALRNLADRHVIALESLGGQKVHAVAGVGNPDRFFSSLRAAGLEVLEHAMPDHHSYTVKDITFDGQLPILITSKDAVKIRSLDLDLTCIYEVCVVADLDSNLDQAIENMIIKLT